MSERNTMINVNDHESMTSEMADKLAQIEIERGKTPAVERIKENYRKEVEEIDAKEIALKCIKSIRQIAPKVMGLEQREDNYNFRIQSLEGQIKKLQDGYEYKIRGLEREVSSLSRDFEIHKKIAKQSVETVNQILLETQKPSLYERLCQKITLLLIKLKS